MSETRFTPGPWRHDKLVEAVREALQQIEYLHAKFNPTGTGEAVIARLTAALTSTREGE